MLTNARTPFLTGLLLPLALAVGACSNDDRQGLLDPGDPSAVLISQRAEVFVPPGSIDEVFLDVNQQVPGFAGMIREEGGLLVLLTDGNRLDDARAALEMQMPGRGLDVASSLAWQQVDFEWKDLARWHTAVIPMLTQEEVVFTDANERLNRIVVGVFEGTRPAAIVEEAVRRGVPREAVLVRSTQPPVPLQTLEDRTRPTRGGLRINDGEESGCTMGFNVKYGGTRTFMTNSHCTDDFAEDTDTPFFQDDNGVSNDSIGIEYLDPPLVDFGVFCPSGRDDCRWSDAALVAYADGVSWLKGGIAKTSSADRWDGSITIAGTFAITGEYGPASVGDTLHKVGATSGWTYGDVDETCVHYDRSTPVDNYMMCQDVVNAGAWHGDSGSPVFRSLGGDSVGLAGILWGGDPPGTSSGARFIFSSVGGIEDDFDTSLDFVGDPSPPSASIAGPDELPPDEECAWQAIASGGTPPYDYSWWGALSGSSEFVYGSLSESSYLWLEVTDDNALADTAQVLIEVDEEFEECEWK